jgi:HD-like signal output (HDOD) protein
MDPTKQGHVPFVLRGLTERELASLYQLASIRQLNAGEVLFREGEVDRSLWFLVGGSLKIERRLNGQTLELAVLSPGNSVEEIMPKKDQQRTASAIALEPSTLMEVKEQGLDSLSSRIESSIYRALLDRVGKRLDDLIEKEMELQDKNMRLVSYIRDDFETRNHAYAHSELIQRILRSFPQLPVHASQLAVRLTDNEVPVSEVVDLVKLDPSLVSMVLKTINSACYNLQSKVSDIQHAVLYLGFNQLYRLVMTESLRSIMPDGPEFQKLLFHSVLISLLSFEMAKICNLKRPERHSTIGLLHDVGKSIILLLGQAYPNLTAIADTVGHSKIGSLLLGGWKLPEVVCLTVEYQHYPGFSPPEEIPEGERENVAVLYLGHLCEGCLQGKEREQSLAPFHREYLDLLGISERTIPELVRNKVLPSMTKRLKSFPADVRQLITESKTRMIGWDDPESEEVPIVWNV